MNNGRRAADADAVPARYAGSLARDAWDASGRLLHEQRFRTDIDTHPAFLAQLSLNPDTGHNDYSCLRR